jgi:hypothetical protein
MTSREHVACGGLGFLVSLHHKDRNMARVSPTQQAAPKVAPQAAKTAPPPVATTTAPVAPVATQAATEATADGSEAPKKRGRKANPNAVKRIFHPALEAAQKTLEKSGKTVTRPTKQIAEIPGDYDAKLHKPLRRADFSDESAFYEYKARELEAKAADLRKQGEQIKSLGGIKNQADAKKLVALQKRMLELTEKLSQGGKVDTSGVMANFLKQLEAKQNAATEENKAA